MTKTALCIGINNYPGTHMDLQGCVNDARDGAAELTSRGFAVTQLIDAKATKAAMSTGFRAIVGGAKKGDVIVITFSGHGTVVPDLNGDEVDGLDKALCTYDLQTGGAALLDDEIHASFDSRAPGVRLVLISDSCHCGTVTRVTAADPDSREVPRPCFMPMGHWLPPEQLPRSLSGVSLTMAPSAFGASAFTKALSRASGDLLLSGCKEGPNNFSYDGRIKGRPAGAFTYYALKALKGLTADATYADWHAAINPTYLACASYSQSPQIVGSAEARKRKIFS